ncbi:hypothetical protein OT109_04600 [Phycisphaeraceae bacterium D3-23]
MPILNVELVTDDGQVPADLAARIADAAGNIFDAELGRVWVKLAGTPTHCYAENAVPQDETPRPVFVSVLLWTHPPANEWERTVKALTRAIAQCSGRPTENVHLLLEPEARGRIAFGG